MVHFVKWFNPFEFGQKIDIVAKDKHYRKLEQVIKSCNTSKVTIDLLNFSVCDYLSIIIAKLYTSNDRWSPAGWAYFGARGFFQDITVVWCFWVEWPIPFIIFVKLIHSKQELPLLEVIRSKVNLVKHLSLVEDWFFHIQQFWLLLKNAHFQWFTQNPFVNFYIRGTDDLFVIIGFFFVMASFNFNSDSFCNILCWNIGI